MKKKVDTLKKKVGTIKQKVDKKVIKTTKRKPTTAGRKRTLFQVKARPGSEVYLAGSFNNWDQRAKKLKDTNGKGEFTTMLYLPKGKHEYKYVINGEWHVDPECPKWVQNECGTLNSLITIS